MNKNKHYVIFMGVKLNKKSANRVGIGIIFGIIGGIISIIIPYKEFKIFNYLIIMLFIAIGYLLIAPKIFK